MRGVDREDDRNGEEVCRVVVCRVEVCRVEGLGLDLVFVPADPDRDPDRSFTVAVRYKAVGKVETK